MVAMVLLTSRGVGISIRKSAEAIVGAKALKCHFGSREARWSDTAWDGGTYGALSKMEPPRRTRCFEMGGLTRMDQPDKIAIVYDIA